MKKPKEKIKKIHSLRHQITAYFIGLLFLSILTITVINGAFLEKYYVTKKIDVLLDLRTTLENTDIDKMMNSNSSKGMESIPDEIQRACSRNNLPGLSLTAAIPAGFPGAKMKKCFRASCSDMSMIWMRTEIRAGP